MPMAAEAMEAVTPEAEMGSAGAAAERAVVVVPMEEVERVEGAAMVVAVREVEVGGRGGGGVNGDGGGGRGRGGVGSNPALCSKPPATKSCVRRGRQCTKRYGGCMSLRTQSALSAASLI